MNSGAKAAGWEHRFRKAVAEGNPPDRLRRYSTDEVERFYAHVVPGPDGHCYWTGPKVFVKNDRTTRAPRRWVWEHAHGPLHRFTPVITSCDEEHCVTLEHLVLSTWGATRYKYTPESIIGALQVFAMRAGRTPSSREWRSGSNRPTWEVITGRFGSWNKALRAAGLEPRKAGGDMRGVTDEKIKAGLRALAKHLGHAPSNREFVQHHAWLAEHGHPSSPTTVRLHLGRWHDALRRAGLKPR
jgi:Homing endonuclease associated repeat